MNDVCKILCGDALEQLRTLPSESVQCCVTSPPYWGLRDYRAGEREIGKEQTPEQYTENLCVVFTEVRRVLKSDGTLWLNLGDSYAGGGNGGGGSFAGIRDCGDKNVASRNGSARLPLGFKPKDLIGIPWMLAFALRARCWYLRSDIIWAKPNCMPESVTDRPTRSHEYLFLLSKSPKYYYDTEAIKEPCSESFLNDSRHKTGSTDKNTKNGYEDHKAQNPKRVHRLFDKQRGHSRRHTGFSERWDQMQNEKQFGMRNKRDVWWISPASFKDAHFAVMPEKLILPCVLAGSKTGDTILDPFAGSGTVGKVALENGRKFIGIELKPDYVKMIERRTQVQLGFGVK